MSAHGWVELCAAQARITELEAVLRKFAVDEPFISDWEHAYCIGCGAMQTGDYVIEGKSRYVNERHEDDCPWVVARTLLGLPLGETMDPAEVEAANERERQRVRRTRPFAYNRSQSWR